MTKHREFHSIYLEDFEVVEQRQDNVRLYPHTEQLPRLLRALNFEFEAPLPKRIARVDHRGDGYHKLLRRIATGWFCTCVNATRSDNLRLYSVLTPDLVAKVAIAQLVTEARRRGSCHSFKFYAGPDFYTEVRLSGKRLTFVDHVLQRFATRVSNNMREDRSLFLLGLLSATELISIRLGPGRAFIVPCGYDILAYPYRESDTEFLILTCLTVNEMSGCEVEVPPRSYNLHYGTDFKKPTLRNWSPLARAKQNKQLWDDKTPVGSKLRPIRRWWDEAPRLYDYALSVGFGPGSQLWFQDRIWGPSAFQMSPGETEIWFDELADLRREEPGVDWDAVLTRQQVEDEKFIRSCVIE